MEGFGSEAYETQMQRGSSPSHVMPSTDLDFESSNHNVFRPLRTGIVSSCELSPVIGVAMVVEHEGLDGVLRLDRDRGGRMMRVIISHTATERVIRVNGGGPGAQLP